MTLQTIIDWNETMLDAIRAGGTPPPVAARAMAVVQTAVFDAINAINGSPYEGYATRTGLGSGASEDAAAISASYQTLKTLFPAFGSELDSRYNAAVASISGQSGVSDGLALGQLAAGNTLQLRSSDGSSASVSYTSVGGVGHWVPTAPAFASAVLPQWQYVKPWTMLSDDQFRPDGPPAVNSNEYTNAYDQVKAIGAIDSTTRTADQTEIANFWADGSGTATPPGHWQAIAQTLASSQNLSTLEAARMFALVSLAVADAGIVAWDAKYTYDFWRPITAINEGDGDGNPNTQGQAGWTPLLTTPAFPEYVSGHSTFSAAAAHALANFFGTSEFTFSSTSDALDGVTRDFTDLLDAADEAGLSRIYGGIHWRYSNEDGQTAGEALAKYIDNYFLLHQNALTSGSDSVTVSADQSTRGLEGNDTITGSEGIDRIYGGSGSDVLKGNFDNDFLFGGDAFADSADKGDTIFGGLGSDTIYGNAGEDVLFGESTADDSTDGGDYLHGGAGYDVLYGNAGDDTLVGSAHGDTVDGGIGNDLIYGGNGQADATDSNDQLAGGKGADTIYGNAGNDTIYGGIGIGDPSDGADLIYGGGGNDIIYGNGGADSIAAGPGNDTIYGGGGNDIFLIGNNNGRDIIYDFAGAGTNGGDALYIISNIDGTGVTTAERMLLLVETEGHDAVIWFNPTNNVTIAGGAGLSAADIVIVNSDSF